MIGIFGGIGLLLVLNTVSPGLYGLPYFILVQLFPRAGPLYNPVERLLDLCVGGIWVFNLLVRRARKMLLHESHDIVLAFYF